MAGVSVEVRGTPSPGLNRFNNLSTAELCASCEKRVYVTERLSTGRHVYHKRCFRCTHCDKILGLGQFTMMDCLPFCKPHYIQIFKERGGVYGGRSSEKSTPASSKSVDRQKSSDLLRTARPDIESGSPSVRSPVYLESQCKSPVTHSTPTTGQRTSVGSDSFSFSDCDSSGNKKRMTSFAATLAMFQNAAESTPASSASPQRPTPSRDFVLQMRKQCEQTDTESPRQQPAHVSITHRQEADDHHREDVQMTTRDTAEIITVHDDEQQQQQQMQQCDDDDRLDVGNEVTDHDNEQQQRQQQQLYEDEEYVEEQVEDVRRAADDDDELREV